MVKELISYITVFCCPIAPKALYSTCHVHPLIYIHIPMDKLTAKLWNSRFPQTFRLLNTVTGLTHTMIRSHTSLPQALMCTVSYTHTCTPSHTKLFFAQPTVIVVLFCCTVLSGLSCVCIVPFCLALHCFFCCCFFWNSCTLTLYVVLFCLFVINYICSNMVLEEFCQVSLCTVPLVEMIIKLLDLTWLKLSQVKIISMWILIDWFFSYMPKHA